MIDYYLKKKCPLNFHNINKEKIRCGSCVWLDKDVHKCIFSIEYPRKVTIKDFEVRISIVNLEQQNKLSNPNRRFVL